MIGRKGRGRFAWLLLAASFALVVAAACGGDDDDDTGGGDVTYGNAGFKTIEIAAGQPIKIGYSGPLSGDLKGIGEPILKAIELAAKDKTIKGHSIQVVAKDDLCSADGGASAATQLLQEGVVAVVGPVCSGAVVAAQPQYEQAGITHVSPSSTAHKPTYPDRGQVFQTFLRTTYSDDIQGPAQAKFAFETLGAKTAYVVYDTDAYGTGLRDAFTKAYEKEGGKILGSEGFERSRPTSKPSSPTSRTPSPTSSTSAASTPKPRPSSSSSAPR
ncbi:branched-chain amino acid ABC transporter substrate-binding protein [Tepidiforma flava]|uniref:Branched-chain amino acid ABC transporter substrate-binding protein n=1 Tax=Tepidiforma flava TaxID=3004094 RepID=A0ABY7M8U9_9CHLR|nr:branched-chain amino acid ABC transporter substrate-binding protein [Tepidiforma flava]WBL36433.1 branched-chain amino acid ABC transporter substrate-binding protein [Tepidiforma flava]